MLALASGTLPHPQPYSHVGFPAPRCCAACAVRRVDIEHRTGESHSCRNASQFQQGAVRSARGGSALHALVALALGLAVGIAISVSGFPAATRVVGWVEPLGTMWVNAIRMTVIPLIVSSLLVAVSDTAPGMVGRLGTRAFVIFVVLLSVMAAITAVVAPLIFAHLTIDPAAAQAIRAGVAPVQRPEMPSFSSWLVSVVPTNPIKSAADGAMLPLVVFTLVFGLAVGRLADDVRAPIVDFFRGVAEATTLLVQWILTLAPYGVCSRWHSRWRRSLVPASSVPLVSTSSFTRRFSCSA